MSRLPFSAQVRNPKPFWSLNHLTFPVAMESHSFQDVCGRDLGARDTAHANPESANYLRACVPVPQTQRSLEADNNVPEPVCQENICYVSREKIVKFKTTYPQP